MKKLLAALTLLSAAFLTPAHTETTECVEITALPATISLPGVYCFKKNLVTSITSGDAITINANNVTLDLNGFKLGGASAGIGTLAQGIQATGRKNITIRNGNILGFDIAIHLDGASGSGHLVEDIRADLTRANGLNISGSNLVVRNNHIVNTGDGSIRIGAFGIVLQNATNSVVVGNVVSGVSETDFAYGIYVYASSVVTISDNVILDINTATTTNGIHVFSSSNISVTNNQIINSSTGMIAIADPLDSATGVDCIGNIIRSYTSGTTGCDYNSGNHVN